MATIAPHKIPPADATQRRAEPLIRRRSRRAELQKSWRLHWQLYLLAAVPLAYFVIFKYIPMAFTVIAFKDYSPVLGPWGSPWVGLDNFQRLFTNPVFLTLLENTFILAFYLVLASFPIPILLAIALNEIRNGWFKRTVQMVTYAPYFISTVVVVSITILVLSPRAGIVNEGLGHLGAGPIDFLGDPDAFRHIYVWSDVWQTMGYSAVIYMAALAGIDPALHEAARVDGASRLQRIRHIDLPGIMPTAVIMLILGVGNMMAIGFEKAYLLQNSLNLAQSEIIPTYVYKTGLINADFSMATAVGLFNSVVNLCLLLAVNFVAKRVTGNGLWR
ncbi:putative aldouronate transport system permease protein [Actinoplanes lutulentus]|uniref:Putative aldouronate transport system permease protein n=1 Tax=Actinoplanes lutulentus TaxID=1287878 RepID=A0A327YXZ1_9ACTN|nr:ABC transporter permease subunit [Actinoplanes lutulentus]MBB2948746.1 putative aldouronate transport system permease protein [Actinoplanes lutulentus]RAK26184.1 putative aldouronate transport system permease protein [Actinoplanes lutulentus]